MAGKLYVVATPIGNKGDITERAKSILADVDIIAAEDTRVSSMLLKSYGIENKMVSNHKFNERKQMDYLIAELQSGKNVAIISDAGTPCISDPGSVLVRAAVENNIIVEGLPGASAVITAISICGFSALNFAFYGFMPRTAKEIKEFLKTAHESGISLGVFYESPNRIKKTMEVIANDFPDVEVCLCNDLTKRFERTYRGTPISVVEKLTSNPDAEKGEYALVISFPRIIKNVAPSKTLSPEALIVDYMIANNCAVKQAVMALTEQYKGTITRKQFYAASLELKKLFNTDDKEADDDE